MRIRFENHDLETEGCGQFIDLTDDVVKVVERSQVRDGMAVVYSPHTTCAVVINERESGFIEDFQEMLENIAPRDGVYYRHDDLSIRTEGGEGAIVFQGTTGADGGCPASFRVPAQSNGSAAAVIRVTSPIGSTEFKFPVRTAP